MRSKAFLVVTCGIAAALANSTFGQGIRGGGAAQPQVQPADDPVQALVSRLDLEKYKATIKGLTQFGDRRQGTERNRKAVDWIEAQLKSYGCPTERIKYEYNPAPRGGGGGAAAAGDTEGARGGGAGQRGQAGRGGGANTADTRGQTPRGTGGVGRQAK